MTGNLCQMKKDKVERICNNHNFLNKTVSYKYVNIV